MGSTAEAGDVLDSLVSIEDVSIPRGDTRCIGIRRRAQLI